MSARTMEKMVDKSIDIIGRIADAKLKNTAAEFKAQLPEAVKATSTSISIELTGLAKDLDTGFPARDMKATMLASASAKTDAKGGRYVDVPFKHGMSENSRYQGMPNEIKAQVKAAIQRETWNANAQGRAERNPLRVTGTMPGSTNTQERFNSKGKTKKVEVEHKTSIHSNMMRMKHGARSAFTTIRRISSSSPANAWWHPGFEGIRALEQAKTEIRRVMQMVFKSELQSAGLKSK